MTDLSCPESMKETSWWIYLTLGAILCYLAYRAAKWCLKLISGRPQDEVDHPAPKQRTVTPHHTTPKVDFPATTPPEKPKKSLNLGDVGTSALNTPKPSPSPQISPAAPMNENPPPPPQPAVTVGPGDFEKALAHAGQKMDRMLAETTELTRQLKLAEKARNEATMGLSQATAALQEQLAQKDAEITKLANQLDQKSSYPSLRALIELRKLCRDMIGTQKQLEHDALIDFITEDIDSRLSALDVQSRDFPVGTRLEDIPGDMVEVSPRHEATTDAAKVNQVAQAGRPCYYLERDSKRIIVAKASVILFKLQAPPSPTSSPA